MRRHTGLESNRSIVADLELGNNMTANYICIKRDIVQRYSSYCCLQMVTSLPHRHCTQQTSKDAAGGAAERLVGELYKHTIEHGRTL